MQVLRADSLSQEVARLKVENEQFEAGGKEERAAIGLRREASFKDQYEGCMKKIAELKAEIGDLNREKERAAQLELQVGELVREREALSQMQTALAGNVKELTEEVVPWSLNKNTADLQAQVEDRGPLEGPG